MKKENARKIGHPTDAFMNSFENAYDNEVGTIRGTSVQMYNRWPGGTDPWLSYKNHPHGILYGAATYNGNNELIKNNGGANVYIRRV